MRNLVCFFLSICLIGCGGMDNPLQSTSTSSRISLEGGGDAASVDVEEGTVIFNSHLDVPSGDLVNPIPSLPDRDHAVETDEESGTTYDGDIWPDEVRNPDDEAPHPDAIEDSGGGGNIAPDDVVDDSDDGLTPDIVDDISSVDVPSNEPDDIVDSDDDDGEIWGEVVD